jgi:hypothetical protein
MREGPREAAGSRRTSREARRKAGKPLVVRYSRKVATEICERLAAGELWHAICNTGGLPSYHAVYRWRKIHPEFAEGWEQAKEMAADLRADRALEVAAAATAATATPDRLHVTTLQWHAGKSSPRRWGSKGEADGADEAGGGGRRLVIEVRQFERAFREAGAAYVREVTAEGEEPE